MAARRGRHARGSLGMKCGMRGGRSGRRRAIRFILQPRNNIMSRTEQSGGKRHAVKYADIPAELRRAANEYTKLLRAREPIPDEIRVKHNKYKRWVACGGKDPDAVKTDRVVYDYIPEELRRASHEYNRLKRRGETPPPDVAKKNSEYGRWVRHRGEPPPRPEEPKGPHLAHLEWIRRIREGESPGDIPASVAEGRAEYLGTAVRKYTACAPSDRKGGRGCRGRHGSGPRRLPYGPGVAVCTNCVVAYRDVPADVTGCGCCGKPLRKSSRSKG